MGACDTHLTISTGLTFGQRASGHLTSSRKARPSSRRGKSRNFIYIVAPSGNRSPSLGILSSCRDKTVVGGDQSPRHAGPVVIGMDGGERAACMNVEGVSWPNL